MNIGIWQLVILALVVLVLFGRGRISEMMGDFGKGIKSFKQGMTEEADRPVTAPPRIEQQSPAPVASESAGATQQPAPPTPTQQQSQMSYDPVTAPPGTDPNPPHRASLPAGSAAPARTMPYDPVTAPPSADNGAGRGG